MSIFIDIISFFIDILVDFSLSINCHRYFVNIWIIDRLKNRQKSNNDTKSRKFDVNCKKFEIWSKWTKIRIELLFLSELFFGYLLVPDSTKDRGARLRTSKKENEIEVNEVGEIIDDFVVNKGIRRKSEGSEHKKPKEKAKAHGNIPLIFLRFHV